MGVYKKVVNTIIQKEWIDVNQSETLKIIIIAMIIIAYPMLKQSIINFIFSKETLNTLSSLLTLMLIGILIVSFVFSNYKYGVIPESKAVSLYNFFTAIIYAPIVEEIVFRGTIYIGIETKWKYVGLFFSSILFAGLHFIGKRKIRRWIENFEIS